MSGGLIVTENWAPGPPADLSSSPNSLLKGTDTTMEDPPSTRENDLKDPALNFSSMAAVVSFGCPGW